MASKNSKDYYKDARIKFKFSMPFDTGVAEFSTKEMLWMDTATGYGYKVGYEDVKGAKIPDVDMLASRQWDKG